MGADRSGYLRVALGKLYFSVVGLRPPLPTLLRATQTRAIAAVSDTVPERNSLF